MSVSANIRCVGIVGAGQMGRGIAQVMAASGLRVRLFDSNPDALDHSLALLRRDLSRSVEKGR